MQIESAYDLTALNECRLNRILESPLQLSPSERIRTAWQRRSKTKKKEGPATRHRLEQTINEWVQKDGSLMRENPQAFAAAALER